MAAILEAYTDPVCTRRVWMVCPTYFSASQIFIDAGLHQSLRAIPEDDEGINIDYLGEQMRDLDRVLSTNDDSVRPFDSGCDHWRHLLISRKQIKSCHSKRKFYAQVIYVVPNFSNPSGRTLSLRRREGLVQLARRHDALIIADDVYDFLQWSMLAEESRRPRIALLPRLVDIDRQLGAGPGSDGFGHAISNGTFSKIVAPGCRTGWVEANAKFINGLVTLGSRVSGGAPSQLSATFISHMLHTGALQRHISNVLQPAYKSRHNAILHAMRGHLKPLGVSMFNPGSEDIVGGYFVWLSLPEPLEADLVKRHCWEQQNLIVAPGTLFNVRGDESVVDLKRNLRLCFAWEDEDVLQEGIRRLAVTITALLNKEVSQLR
ncbi:hypothetical protein S40285_08837 [Stachybotrys chlorohalonatus IBT 40285]|uniref:Aminotransferase class I/classII large domain-containing protein n=1 Tax=Stachybotrys chlorohalonatus (strain IBT 40285) TaxID=1283841 RepID=A0A084QTJ6_STAC4|nr:hypothetical protein S40285_08837 [Stachybotrys chlorohalonata IBT 40285]